MFTTPIALNGFPGPSTHVVHDVGIPESWIQFRNRKPLAVVNIKDVFLPHRTHPKHV